ncbi:zonular occludens toxin, partial [Xanthomonas axonopodis pv. vasculorum]
MIGDTASISLLTGLPGSGKSLRIIQAIRYLMDKGAHVYVCNIDGISVPGTTPWADPHKWQDLPAGSILFVDEAQ